MKKTRFLVVILVLTMLFSAVAPGFANPNGMPGQALTAFDQRILARASAERALEHVRVLSEDIGPRPAGLPNEHKAAEYIAGYFESLGYEVEVQEFAVTGGNANVNVGYLTFADGTLWETGSAAGGHSLTGRKIFNAGNGQPSDYPADLEPGFIALVRRGTAFTTIATNAKAAGAAGVIIYNTIFGGRGNYPSAFSPSVSTDIPVLGCAFIHGMRLIEMLEQGEVVVDLETIRYTNRRSKNVIATKPASNGDPDAPIIAVTGHFDSVVGSPGANDNASGVALLMELARVMRNYNTDKELRFIAFGAEEVGLQGANYYVNQLRRPGREDEFNRFMGVFNADMVGTNHPNVTNLVAATPNGVQHIVTDSAVAAGARLGDSNLVPTTFGSSDHVPFHNAGIPAALFIWLGGNLVPSSYEIELYYHTPQDTIEENMCLERFQYAINVIGAAVFDLARKQVPALSNSKLRKAS